MNSRIGKEEFALNPGDPAHLYQELPVNDHLRPSGAGRCNARPVLSAGFGEPWRGKNTGNNTPFGEGVRLGSMGKLGKEVKGAVDKAAKSKGSGGKSSSKTSSKKGGGSGADKAKRAARELLK